MMTDNPRPDDVDAERAMRSSPAAPDGSPSGARDESDLDSLQTMRLPSQRGNALIPPDATSDLDLAQTIRPVRSSEAGKPAPASHNGQLPVGYVLDGRLIVTKMHGQGAMGAVYRVIDSDTQAEFAVKILTPSFASDPQALLELKQEVARAAPLTHQNLLSLKYFADFGPLKYIVMENIEGESLEALRIRRGGRVSAEELDRLVPQIFAGLDYLHDRGIVHLDVKPQNIMVTSSGEIKITDYGIARTIREQLRRQDDLQQQLGGTLCYMSPELIRPGVVCDRRTDIYAVGMMLYHLLTGSYPFNAADSAAIVKWHLDEQHQLGSLSPMNYAALITRALRVNRDERWTSCREMSQIQKCDRCGAAVNSSTGKCTSCASLTSTTVNLASVDEAFARLDAELAARAPKKNAVISRMPQARKRQAAAIATSVLPVDVATLPDVLRRLDAKSREEQVQIGWLYGGSREVLYEAWTQKAVESYRRLQQESETTPDLRRELDQYIDRYGSGRDKTDGHSLAWRYWNGSSTFWPTWGRRVFFVGLLVSIAAGLLVLPLMSVFVNQLGKVAQRQVDAMVQAGGRSDTPTHVEVANKDQMGIKSDMWSVRKWLSSEAVAAESAFEMALKQGEPFGLRMNMTSKDLDPTFVNVDLDTPSRLMYGSNAGAFVNHPDFSTVYTLFVTDKANAMDPGRLSCVTAVTSLSVTGTAVQRAATFSAWAARLTTWFGACVDDPKPYAVDPSAQFLAVWRRDRGARLPSSVSQVTLSSIELTVAGKCLFLAVYFKNDPERGG